MSMLRWHEIDTKINAMRFFKKISINSDHE
jgi:hypothetical protein